MKARTVYSMLVAPPEGPLYIRIVDTAPWLLPHQKLGKRYQIQRMLSADTVNIASEHDSLHSAFGNFAKHLMSVGY